MLTQCPGCQTVFRITSDILRAAHGQVRCGRCNTQFDAIEYLQEDESATDAPAAPESPTTEFAPTFDAQAVEHEEITLEGNRIEISGVYRTHEPASAEPVAEHTHTIIEEFNIDTEEWQNPFAEPVAADQESNEEEASAAALSQVLASLEPEEDKVAATPAIEVHEEGGEDIEVQFEPQDDDASPAPAPATDVAIAKPVASAATTAINETAPARDLSVVTPVSTSAPFDALMDDEQLAPRRWPWTVACGALVVLLVGQALHHYRQTLVRHPSFGPRLTQLYALVGQPLEPRWELSAYGIKQWGIVSDPQAPGTLRVRASITNNAQFAQPYPLLKLTLEDRFGAHLGMREFKPSEYLPNPGAAVRRLPAGTTASIDLAIVDPGEAAVGFQFNVCLQRVGGLECTG